MDTIIETLKKHVLNRELGAFRDPFPDQQRYSFQLDFVRIATESQEDSSLLRKADSEEQAAQNQSGSGHFVKEVLESWWVMYAVGEPLDRINAQMRAGLSWCAMATKTLKKR